MKSCFDINEFITCILDSVTYDTTCLLNQSPLSEWQHTKTKLQPTSLLTTGLFEKPLLNFDSDKSSWKQEGNGPSQMIIKQSVVCF